MKQYITCMGCGFMTIDGPRGSYDICPLCDWEDDPVQNKYVYSNSGANHESLFNIQEEIMLKYPIEIQEINFNGIVYTRNGDSFLLSNRTDMDPTETITSDRYIKDLKS